MRCILGEPRGGRTFYAGLHSLVHKCVQNNSTNEFLGQLIILATLCNMYTCARVKECAVIP